MKHDRDRDVLNKMLQQKQDSVRELFHDFEPRKLLTYVEEESVDSRLRDDTSDPIDWEEEEQRSKKKKNKKALKDAKKKTKSDGSTLFDIEEPDFERKESGYDDDDDDIDDGDDDVKYVSKKSSIVRDQAMKTSKAKSEAKKSGDSKKKGASTAKQSASEDSIDDILAQIALEEKQAELRQSNKNKKKPTK